MELAPPAQATAPAGSEAPAVSSVANVPAVTGAGLVAEHAPAGELIQGLPGGGPTAVNTLAQGPTQPLIEGFPGGISPAPIVPERPAPEMIQSLPGSAAGRSEVVVSPPSAPNNEYWGGYTGNSLSAPIIGLPAGMTVQEGHVLARQQNAATAAANAAKPTESPAAWAYPESEPAQPAAAADPGGESATRLAS